MRTVELRIGNYITDLKSKEIRQYDQYDIGHNHIIGPVVITDEILKKIGFVNYSIMGPDGYELEYWPSGKYINLWPRAGADQCIKIKCKFLHNLQNLYFCLFGVELEIKL